MPLLLQRLLAGLVFLAISGAQAGELTVSAASSLTQAFKEIARSYEAEHSGTQVLLNFGASGSLLQQVAKGAPVDVFAAADQETLDQAAQRQLIVPSSRQDFASNNLVVVVPSASQLNLNTFADLTQAGVEKIAIGNPASVPVGRYSQQALHAEGLWKALQAKAITTQNVRQSLNYVARGEVEAGFVYATDAREVATVKVAFDVPLKVAIRYPIARVAGSAHAVEGERFIAYVQSPAGQAILARFGFKQP